MSRPGTPISPIFACRTWVKDGLSKQTGSNELFCSKSGEEPLNIAYFLLILWLFNPQSGEEISRNE